MRALFTESRRYTATPGARNDLPTDTEPNRVCSQDLLSFEITVVETRRLLRPVPTHTRRPTVFLPGSFKELKEGSVYLDLQRAFHIGRTTFQEYSVEVGRDLARPTNLVDYGLQKDLLAQDSKCSVWISLLLAYAFLSVVLGGFQCIKFWRFWACRVRIS